MKMKPFQMSQFTGFNPYCALSRPKNSPSCCTNVRSPLRSYRHPWYLQVN